MLTHEGPECIRFQNIGDSCKVLSKESGNWMY